MKFSDLFKEQEELAGPFEAQVMTAIEILGKDAYSAPIQRKIEEMTGKRASFGKIFITLDRMEDKGYIGSRITEKPGQRPRRFYWRGGHEKRFDRVRERRNAFSGRGWRPQPGEPGEASARAAGARGGAAR